MPGQPAKPDMCQIELFDFLFNVYVTRSGSCHGKGGGACDISHLKGVQMLYIDFHRRSRFREVSLVN